MSARFNDPVFATRVRDAPPEVLNVYRAKKVTDIILHFKGFNPDQGALVNNKQEFQALLELIFNDPVYRAWHDRPIMRTWNGAFESDRGLEDAVWTSFDNFDPRGKLIVMGESAGGLNALQFATKLQRELPFFDWGFQTDPQITRLVVPPDVRGWDDAGYTVGRSATNARILIDLVATMDASFKPPSMYSQLRRVPTDVVWNKNYFETLDDSVGEIHNKTVPADGDVTLVDNFDRTAQVQNSQFIFRGPHRALIVTAQIELLPDIRSILEAPPSRQMEPLCPAAASANVFRGLPAGGRPADDRTGRAAVPTDRHGMVVRAGHGNGRFRLPGPVG